MTTIVYVSLFLVVAIVAALIFPEVRAIFRGRHWAGVRRYLRSTPTEPLRPGDKAWLRELGDK